MDMHTRLSQAALEKALRKAGYSDPELGALLEDLPKILLPVPHPAYGKIVYDLPNEYEFESLRNQFDEDCAKYVDFFKENLEEYYFHRNLNDIQDVLPNEEGIRWKNGFFGEGDSRALYAFVAGVRPERVFEIGSGNSTRIVRKAVKDFSLETRITSIDPAPRADLRSYSDEWIEEPVQNVDCSVFNALEPGDILFFDGSHVSHVGTDVITFFLEILPKLSKGVIVQIHDIHLPWEYDESFRVRHYNEHHMLAAMILNNPTWQILFPARYLSRTAALQRTIPNGSSLWMVKERD